MSQNNEMKCFIRLMNLIEKSRTNSVIVSTPTEEKLRAAYELANACGLNFKITNQFLKQTLEKHGENTGVTYSCDGVGTCKIIHLYSSHIWDLDEVQKEVLGHEE